MQIFEKSIQIKGLCYKKNLKLDDFLEPFKKKMRLKEQIEYTEEYITNLCYCTDRELVVSSRTLTGSWYS